MAGIGKSEITTAILVAAVIFGGLAVVSENPMQFVQQAAGGVSSGGSGGESDVEGAAANTPIPTATTDSGGVLSGSVNESRVERQLHLQLNRLRSRQGRSQLLRDPEMSRKANQRAEWMANHTRLDHPSEPPYTCPHASETAAYVYADGDAEAIAQSVIKVWMNSKPSKQRVLGKDYVYDGVGVATVQVEDGTRVYAVVGYCEYN